MSGKWVSTGVLCAQLSSRTGYGEHAAPYSILNRIIEREVLPLAQRFGMGTLVWGPLGQGRACRRVKAAGARGRRSGVRVPGAP